MNQPPDQINMSKQQAVYESSQCKKTLKFSSFSSYSFPWLYCVEFSETCDQVSFIPFLSGRRGAFSPLSPKKRRLIAGFCIHCFSSLVSFKGEDEPENDTKYSERTLQSWAWHALNLRVPHSSFRLVKFFKNLNIPSRWNGIINKLSKGMRRNSHFCCTVWRHKHKKTHKK